jgi:hypothetical protein
MPEMLRIPYCLNDRLTDGGKTVSPTHRPRSTPQKHYFFVFDTHFCQRLSKLQGLVRSEETNSIYVSITVTHTHPADIW